MTARAGIDVVGVLIAVIVFNILVYVAWVAASGTPNVCEFFAQSPAGEWVCATEVTG